MDRDYIKYVEEFKRVEISIDKADENAGDDPSPTYIGIAESVFDDFLKEKIKFYNNIKSIIQGTELRLKLYNDSIKKIQEDEAKIWKGLTEWYSEFINQKINKVSWKGVNTSSALREKKKGKDRLDKADQLFKKGDYKDSFINAKEAFNFYYNTDDELDTAIEGNKSSIRFVIIITLIGVILGVIITIILTKIGIL